MNTPGLVIMPPDEDGSAVAIALSASQLEVPTPEARVEARDVAVQFFNPLIHALLRRRALVMSGYWREPRYRLDAARCRLLDRVALALGGVYVAPQQSPARPLANHRGQPEALTGQQAASLPGYHQTAKTEALRPLAKGSEYMGALTRCATPTGPVLGAALAGARLRPAYDGPGVGAWRTDGRNILIVGDRPNSGQHAMVKQRVPFFSLHHGGCSLWLAQQLDDGGIPEEYLYWINGYTWDGVPTSRSFISELRPRAVVALGANAGRWCKDAGIVSAGVVDHPQHWKRFHCAERYPLIHLLRSLLS